MKVTKDPKTGADEMQMPEYMPHGPASNPIGALRDRITALEAQVRTLQERVASLQASAPLGIDR